jgi:hypothetical protein
MAECFGLGKTYERLHQVCTSDCMCEIPTSMKRPEMNVRNIKTDKVGSFGSIAPGDRCSVPLREFLVGWVDDKLTSRLIRLPGACCCNSIAWSLSMLCMK